MKILQGGHPMLTQRNKMLSQEGFCDTFSVIHVWNSIMFHESCMTEQLPQKWCGKWSKRQLRRVPATSWISERYGHGWLDKNYVSMNPNTLERLVEHPKKFALPNFWHVHQPILAHTRRRNSKLVRPVGNLMRSYRKLFDVVCTSFRGNGWLKYHITDRVEQFSALEKTEWPDSNYWALPSWKWCLCSFFWWDGGNLQDWRPF